MKSIFGELSVDEFLRDYWQKKPLLIRDALPNFRSPLRPEELAGLALEDSVDSRLILEEGGDHPWELRYGPFSERDFRKLPAEKWTLLVQEVDRLVPEVGALLDHFRFVPDWRIDDVMVSYAPDEGGVGAHIDNYDVFLLQGMGKRRWQISYEAVEVEDLVPDIDVSILADFEPDEDWILEPGDMLYLPPRIAHYGVAIGDCMTYSIGFRAPSDADLISSYVAALEQDAASERRYSDPDLKASTAPGRIDVRTLEEVRKALRRAIEDEASMDRWFGRYATESRRGYYPPLPDEEVTPRQIRKAIERGAVIQRAPGVRMAYFTRDDGTTGFFVAGEEYEFDGALANLAALLANRRSFRASELAEIDDDDAYELLADLVNEGFLELQKQES